MFVDEATGFVRIYFTPTLDAKDSIKSIDYCLADQRSDIKKWLGILLSDHGKNYLSEKVIDHLLDQKPPISTSNSTPYNRKQNGMAEKCIQDLRRTAE